jgi:hypothetical protein
MEIGMKVTLVSMSSKPEDEFRLPIPHHILSEPSPFFTKIKSRERIQYLADKQTRSINQALEKFPETSHILWCDSYYLGQTDSLSSLINNYGPSDKIVGGAIMCDYKLYLFPEIAYYDTWCTPEYAGLRKLPKFHGQVPVSGVGAVYLFPRHTFESVGYGVPEPFPESGCHHNYLCRKSGLPIFVDWDAIFWRRLSFPMWKRIKRTIVRHPATKRLRESIHK